MSLKKLSASGLIALTLCLCCAQDLTAQHSNPTAAPLTILNERRTDEGLSVEVRNTGPAPIEYFEIHLSGSRVWAGRNSMTERLSDDPRNLEQEALSLAPQETRTFQFAVRGPGAVVGIKLVLFSNGQGWMNGWWLKKLDQPDANGMLWNVDTEERKR